MELALICAEDNDLYGVLLAAGVPCTRYDDVGSALREASRHVGLLALADTYPRPQLRLTAEHLEQAAARRLRLLIEYPAAVAGLEIGQPCPTSWERVVVSSDFFAPAVERLSILALHGCWYLPTRAEAPHLVAARVAGYRTAVYGLPSDAPPLLFELPGRPVLIAVTKLSQVLRGRYGPLVSWQHIWARLLEYLLPGCQLPALHWAPTVTVALPATASVTPQVEATTLARSLRWFACHALYSIDWKKGVIEGFESSIDHEGNQLRRTWPRGDCIGESAMVFAWDWVLTGNPLSRQRAGQLLDYVLSSPDFHHDDPADPAFGLNNWSERNPVFYGDDNARVLLPALTVARLVDDCRWDERILRCLLANLRTTGRLGFRRARINHPRFAECGGWQFFYGEDHVHYAPHYQAYLWAAFLWAHALVGDPEMLEKPRRALAMTMAAFPEEWRWTNGLAQEIARMLLPLSFLVRVQDTPEHRAWLQRMADELLQLMQPCGAIRELLGPAGHGAYGPPPTNEAYGTAEATLIQTNGDPACDLLYTANYALLGLHEAAAATQDARLREAADRLTAFLCRIQVRSVAQPYLDGAWMRAFDYELWEYWGSSADRGWGPWSVETGWTNAWIAAVLAMRRLGTSLFDLGQTQRLRRLYPRLRAEMLPETEPTGQ